MALPLRVDLSSDRVDANPGDSFAVEVTARNTSDIVEHYSIEALGLPAGVTVRAEPEVLKLRPGETATASMQFTVQPEPPAPAGAYLPGILVRSRYRGDVSRCEELHLNISPTEKVSVSVEPQVATGGRSARFAVGVVNHGNTLLRLRLTATDPERQVASRFHPPTVDLAPGATAQVRLDVRAQVPWKQEKQRSLTIEAIGTGVQGAAQASFVQHASSAPRWIKVAGVVAAVVAVAAAGAVAVVLLTRDDEPVANPTPPPTASPTMASPTPAPTPRLLDLTAPFGQPADGVIPGNAFAPDGVYLRGRPEAGTSPECAAATAVAVVGDDTTGRFLTAALPNDPAACNEVPVEIEFDEPAISVRVVSAGAGDRWIEAFYRDQWSTLVDGLLVTGGDEHEGIERVVVHGPASVPEGGTPSAALRTVQFTPISE
jgi:hypothetical protein